MRRLSLFFIGITLATSLASCKPIANENDKITSLASDVHEILIETPKVSLATKQMKDSEACEAVKCIFLESYVTSDNYGSTGKIKALIPASGLDEFLTKVTAQANEVKKHSISQSISAVKADFNERLKIKKTIYEKLLASAQDAKSESVNAILATEKELARLQEEIETTNAIITANKQVSTKKEDIKDSKDDFLDVIIAQVDGSDKAEETPKPEDKKKETKPADKAKDAKKAPAPKPKKYSALSPLVLVDIDYRTPTLMGSFDIAPIKRAWGQAKDIASGSIADAIIFGSYALPWLPIAIILAWLISIALRKKKSRRRVKAYRYQAPAQEQPKLSKKEQKRLKKEEDKRLKEEARLKKEQDKQQAIEDKKRLKEEAKLAKKNKKGKKDKSPEAVDDIKEEPSLYSPKLPSHNDIPEGLELVTEEPIVDPIEEMEPIEQYEETAPDEDVFSSETEDAQEDVIEEEGDDDEEYIASLSHVDNGNNAGGDIYVTQNFFGKIKKPSLNGGTQNVSAPPVAPIKSPAPQPITPPTSHIEEELSSSNAENIEDNQTTATPASSGLSKGILGSSVLSGLSLNQSSEREAATQDAAQEWEDVAEESSAIDFNPPEEIITDGDTAEIEYEEVVFEEAVDSEEVEYEYIEEASNEENSDGEIEYEYVEAEEGAEYPEGTDFEEGIEYEYVEGEENEFEEILDESSIFEEPDDKNG